MFFSSRARPQRTSRLELRQRGFVSGTMAADLTCLFGFEFPVQLIAQQLDLPARVRLSLTCREMNAKPLEFARETEMLDSKQHRILARELGLVLLSRPRVLRKAGGRDSLFFRRVCEAYFWDQLDTASTSRRLHGRNIRAFICDMLQKRDFSVPRFLGRTGRATLLHLGARAGESEFLQAILDSNKIDKGLHLELNEKNQTALTIACQSCVDCALLLARSFRWPSTEGEVCSPLHGLCMTVRDRRLRQQSAPGQPSILSSSSEAVAAAAAAALTRLSTYGEKKTSSDDADFSLKVTELIEVLLSHNPSCLEHMCYGAAPIHLQTSPEVIRALCRARADPNLATGTHNRKTSTRVHGDRPLHLHAWLPANVTALLECNADPSMVNAKRRTPLHVAASLHCYESLRLLLEAAAAAKARGGTVQHKLPGFFFMYTESGPQLRVFDRLDPYYELMRIEKGMRHLCRSPAQVREILQANAEARQQNGAEAGGQPRLELVSQDDIMEALVAANAFAV